MLAGLAASGQDLGNPSLFQPGDFVELSRSGCYGECPAYSVRVFEDGDVIWNGKFYVKVRGEKHSRITQETAHPGTLHPRDLRDLVRCRSWLLDNEFG